MRPVNSKERRVKFLLFVLLFVLSTLPLLLLVYQYGKLDVAENNFLRERYKDYRMIQRNKDEDRRIVDELMSKAKGVKDYLNEKNPEMLKFESNYSYTLTGSIDEIRPQGVPQHDHADSVLVQIVEDMKGSLKLFNGVYANGIVLKGRFDDKVKEFEKLEKEHLKCPVVSPFQ